MSKVLGVEAAPPDRLQRPSPWRFLYVFALGASLGFSLSNVLNSDRRKEVVSSLVTCIDEAKKSLHGWEACNAEADKLSKQLTSCTKSFVAMEKSCRAICGMER